MATESVKILIEAEDKASAQIVAATKKIEGTVKATKDLTKNAKSSTEIFGSLAGALGGTEIGSFANQIGGLTGKLGEFSEIQKAGGAGSLAFKAGLVGVAGVIAFQVGNAIGNVIFQTEKWTEALKTATEESKRLESVASNLRSERFTDTTTDIELIRDPEKKQAEYQKLLADLKTNVVGVEGQVKSSQKAVDEWNAAWQITGDRKGFAEQAKQQLDNDKERLKQLQEQEKEIQRILGIEKEREETRQRNAALDADAKYLESLDKQLSLLKAIKEDETGIAALREQAAQATSGLEGTDAAKQAEDKLKQIKALQEQIDLEKQAREEKKAAIKEIADAEFAATMAAEKAFMSERDRLAEQKVLLNQGAEAAHAFRLAKQGLSEEDAKSFAKQQTELDKQKQVQDKMKARETAAPLQAFSSRFLTRGPTDDKMLDIAKTQLKVQQEQLVELKKKPQAPVVRDLRLVEVG
jgi:DNA repair exonuclease SbcCD ATPase subunit